MSMHIKEYPIRDHLWIWSQYTTIFNEQPLDLNDMILMTKDIKTAEERNPKESKILRNPLDSIPHV